MKYIALIFFCSLFSIFIFSKTGLSCTSFFIEEYNMKVAGSNMDSSMINGLIFVNKRNVSKTTLGNLSGQEPATWTSKYGSITLNYLCTPDMPKEGINEAGLTVIASSLSETVYPEPDSRPYVFGNCQWIQYQLDNFRTVYEVIESDSQIRPINGGLSHFLVADNEGNCAAIEFLDGEMVYYTGETLPYKTLANDTYYLNINLINNYEGFGGSQPIPEAGFIGSYSWNRFIRSAYKLENYDGSDLVDYGFEILDFVKNTIPNWETKWSTIYDLQNRCIHFHTYNNQEIRSIYLDVFDFSCDTPIEFIDIYADLSGDISYDFIDHPQEMSCIETGDFNEDKCIDRTDLSIIIMDIRSSEPHSTEYDLNGDGVVNIADARFLVNLFTNPRGVACD